MNKNIKLLKLLWQQFGDIPVDNQDRIEKGFTVFDNYFEKGTSKFDVWDWFDRKCPNNLHDDLMFPKLS